MSAESNLRFDFGSPWLTVSWRGGLSVFFSAHPPGVGRNSLSLWDWKLCKDIDKKNKK